MCSKATALETLDTNWVFKKKLKISIYGIGWIDLFFEDCTIFIFDESFYLKRKKTKTKQIACT